jgi:dUTPase
MTSPLILGNDFAEQFEISIIRSKGVTRLRFGDEGGAIIVQNVDNERQKVTTLISRVDTKDHRKSYRPKTSNAKAVKEGICRSLVDTEIPPNTSKRIKLLIPWKDEMQQGLIQPGGKLTLNKNLEVLDGLFLRNQDSIIVSNTSNSPINIKKGERIATLLSTSNLDEEPNDLV